MKNLDIRNRDMTKTITFKQLWILDQFKKLRLDKDLDSYTNDELKEYLLKKYDSRNLINGRLYNNTNEDNEIINQEQFINKFLNEPDILSGYSCLYKNQKNSVNIGASAIEELLNRRKFYKKKMEAADHGSAEYIYYRVLQLTYKVLANSYYGILGQHSSVFYNPFIQNSITMTGQDLITTSIIGMENFLSNNVPYEDTDDVLQYIINIKEDDHKFNILDYLDQPITKDELLQYILSHKKDDAYLNSDIIKKSLDNLSDEDISRCYYKNQILNLIKNKWFKDKLQSMLKYTYAEQPDEKMVNDLNDFKEKVIDFCFYNYLIENRYKRAMIDKRKSIITIDTDSRFVFANK